jgi:hypothetical protein
MLMAKRDLEAIEPRRIEGGAPTNEEVHSADEQEVRGLIENHPEGTQWGQRTEPDWERSR